MTRFLPALLLLASCSGDDGAAAPDAQLISNVTEVDCGSATIAATITTVGFAYSPMTATISVGEVVEFHPSSTSHNVVGNDPGLQVGFGGDKCFSFDEPGTYNFHCNPHQFTGSIIVQ